MSTEIALTDNKLIEFLKITGVAQNLTTEEQTSFLEVAKTYGLNPFKREIYVSKYGTNFSIITGYEVYIKRAERSGQLDGWSATTSGSIATNDLKATVTIYRKDRHHPFIWEAYYDECVQKTREGRVTKFWEKANFMTKKVAISQGFRLCFSDELGGMPYTDDEMPDHTEDIIHEVVNDVKQIEVIVEKKIPSLNEKQFEKVLGLSSAEMNVYFEKFKSGELILDGDQVLELGNAITEKQLLGQ